MSNEDEEGMVGTSKPEEIVAEPKITGKSAAKADETDERALNGKILVPFPEDLMVDTCSGGVSPTSVVRIGIVMVVVAVVVFGWRVFSPAITAPEAAFCCTVFLSGSLLIVTALAMVLSRAADERRIKDNWYKDQLDDYLARKDRASNNTGTR